MKRELQFLAGYIDKGIIESKVWPIKDAFQSDGCFDGVHIGVRHDDVVIAQIIPGICLLVLVARKEDKDGCQR